MKVLKKSAVFFFALLIMVLSAVPVFANDVVSPLAKNHPYKDYYIENYDIKINVLENNTLEITEKISVYFNQQRHGIFRKIPLSNRVQRADGSTGTTHAKVKNVSVSDPYEASAEGSYYVVQIGDPDKFVYNSKDYTISYSYVMGKDIGEGFDELYFNLIGGEWDTYIDNASFTVTMPKEFDADKIGISTGTYGTVGTETVEFSVSGNEISGRILEGLSPNEALTLRAELPEGYFYFNMAAYYARLSLMVLIPLAAFLVVLILWIKFGRDKKVVEVVEFYPPENMSSIDVAFWFKGTVTGRDVIPLMIELANEGYLKINQFVKNSMFKNKTDFMIEYVKPYDGGDSRKRRFFDGLFKNGRTRVYKKDLENKFYTTVNYIVSDVNSLENRKLVFDSKSMTFVLVGVLLSVLSGVAACFIRSGTIGGSEKEIAMVAGLGIAAVSLILSFFIRRRTGKGHEMLQKITGFKKFLETAEKERLEMLVDENPTYYYDILPYAYVLGVSDAWTKNFEGIEFQPPQWYGGSMFDRMLFWSFMNSTFNSATNAMTSAPQSSSSGGFSGGGGGFSGGGSGGGGGGSW